MRCGRPTAKASCSYSRERNSSLRHFLPVAMAAFPHKNILQRSIIEILADGEEHHIREIRKLVAADLGITRESLSREYQYQGRSAGGSFARRMNNVLIETKNEGSIVSSKRGYYQLALESTVEPRTESDVGYVPPERPMTRKEYRKWLISELARIELQ